MLKRIFKFFLKLILLVSVAIVLFITSVNHEIFGHIYTKQELKTFKNETASLVLSDNGTVVGKYFNQNRTNTRFEQLPKHLINALVATEDARYFEHKGIDSRSLVRVLFKTILMSNKRSGGGSTITQQLAKNMYGRSKYEPFTMLINKTKEAIQAYRIEHTFNKKEILTLYLNTVSFGENIYGIETAALRYFNKKVSEINTQEAAVLIGILKANTFYNPRLHPQNSLNRRNIVLQQMEKYQYITTKTYDSIQKLPLQLNYTNLSTQNRAGYFLAMVKKEVNEIITEININSKKQWNLEKDGLRIETTLDIDMQGYAIEAFKNHLSVMQKKLRKQYQIPWLKNKLNTHINDKLKSLNIYEQKSEKHQQLIFDWKGYYTDSISKKDSLSLEETLLHAGLIAMNPKNGAIKTWVGGIDYNTHPYDQIFAQRQLASTFKPIVYAAAIETGKNPCDYLNNDPIIVSDYDNWSPENADKSTGGKYSLTGALINSKNIPTVNLYFETGFKPIDTLWKKMNFSSILKNNPSLALGTTNASIYEVAEAYTTFANEGYKINPKCISKIINSDGKILYQNNTLDKENILEKRTAQLINAMLQKAVNKGTGTSLRNKYNVTIPLAGKTGTSQNYSDAWFVSYNPSLVMVSRVGATSPKIHFYNGDGSGGRLALPLVAKTLKKVQHKKQYNKDFPPLTEDLLNDLNCEDYKEKTGFENFFDFLKNDKKNFEKEQRKSEKKKNKESFFKKIFKRKKKN